MFEWEESGCGHNKSKLHFTHSLLQSVGTIGHRWGYLLHISFTYPSTPNVILVHSINLIPMSYAYRASLCSFLTNFPYSYVHINYQSATVAYKNGIGH